MTGYEPGDLLTSPANEPPFLNAARQPTKPARVAISADLGSLPVAGSIRAALEGLAAHLGKAGVTVHRGSPAVDGAMDAFRALRGEGFFATWETSFEEHYEKFPKPVLADLLRGRDQPGRAIVAANRYRSEFYRRAVDFLDEHDFLICPATQALPFPVEMLYLSEIEGVPMQDYLDWIAITAIWSITSLPAIAIPIGFSPEGLPIGIQIISHGKREANLFRLAAWIERELALPKTPIDPR
jgi:amidase